jgi:hypothetical protein
MPEEPRLSIDDEFAEGLDCAICGTRALSVHHVEHYPDFVGCDACGSAFVLEDMGERVMYGRMPPEFAQTARFALRQWAFLEAVARRAAAERPPPAAPVPAEAEPPARPEASPFAGVEAPEPEAPTMAEEPEAFERIAPFGAPETEAEVPEAPMPGAPVPARSEPAVPAYMRPEQVEAPVSEEPVQPLSEEEPPPPEGIDWSRIAAPEEDLTEPQAEAAGDALTGEEAQEADKEFQAPDWLRSHSELEMAPQGEDWQRSILESWEEGSPAAPSEGIPEWLAGAGEGPPSKEEVPDWLRPAPPEQAAGEEIPDWLRPSRPEPAPREEIPDWLRPSPPEQAAEEVPGAPPAAPGWPGEDDKTDALWEPPAWIREAGEEGELPQEEAAGLPPWGTESPGIEAPPAWAREQTSPLPPRVKEPYPPALEEPPVEEKPAPATPRRRDSREPPPGQRHRVMIRGNRVNFPGDVCAHCLRTPVRGKLAVVGTLPDARDMTTRREASFILPLCATCRRRAAARSVQEVNARLQALLLAGVFSLFLVVGTVVLLLIDILAEDPLTGFFIMLLVATVGFTAPAVLLMSRASRPPPPDAFYVRTTLFVPFEESGATTAFEWRNQGYAERFFRANEADTVGGIIQVRDALAELTAAGPA